MCYSVYTIVILSEVEGSISSASPQAVPHFFLLPFAFRASG
jgi:hypothetical protein